MEEYGYVSGNTPSFWSRFAPYIKSKTFTFVILAALAVATPLTAFYLQNNTFDTRQRASGSPISCEPKIYVNGQTQGPNATVQPGQEFDIAFDLNIRGVESDERAIINFGPSSGINGNLQNLATTNDSSTAPGFIAPATDSQGTSNSIFVSANGLNGNGHFIFRGLKFNNPGSYQFAYSVQNNLSDTVGDNQQSFDKYVKGESNPHCNGIPSGWALTTVTVSSGGGGGGETPSTDSCIPGLNGTACSAVSPSGKTRCEYPNSLCTTSGGKWACAKGESQCYTDCTGTQVASCPAPTAAPPQYGAYNCSYAGRGGHCASFGTEPYASRCAGTYAGRDAGCSGGQYCYTECPGDTTPPATINCQNLSSVPCSGTNSLTRCEKTVSNACKFAISQSSSALQYYTSCDASSSVPIENTCAGAAPTSPPGGGGGGGGGGTSCAPYTCANSNSTYFCRGVGGLSTCYSNSSCTTPIPNNDITSYCSGTTVPTATPTPTGTTGGPNPSPTPTGTEHGTVVSPTGSGPSPTGGNGGVTLALELILQGIGLPTNLIDGEAQPNVNPASNVRTKPVTVEIMTAQSTTVPIIKTDSLIYDPTSKKFKANIDIGAITSNFSVQIRMPGYATQLVGQRSGAVIQQPAASITIRETILAADINSDGFITGDDYEKAGSSSSLKACFNKTPITSHCQYADINADGKIDLIDYKFLIDNIIKRK